ncbi:MAG: hypothetical protein AAF808_23585, partial [Cyanobacteria bacterium P01_D01_bin.2]
MNNQLPNLILSGLFSLLMLPGISWAQGTDPCDGVTSFTALEDLCIDAGLQTLTSGLPVGGTYSGSGVIDNNDGTFSFDPEGAGAGIHSLTYETASGWTQLGADIDGEAGGDESGWSVSFSSDGSRLAIGATRNAGNGFFDGHVRVYEWSGSAWAQLGADIDGEAIADRSGESVSLSSDGSRLAIGAIENDGNGPSSGHVRVYEWSGSAWTQLGADIDGEAAGDRSGWSVSFSSDGSRLAIGAAGNDGNGSLSGHVRVYEWSGSAWAQLGQDIDGEAGGDQSGYSVSLSSDGSRLAIGAIENDGNGFRSGHVRVYEWSGSAWTQLGADIDGEAAGDQSG